MLSFPVNSLVPRNIGQLELGLGDISYFQTDIKKLFHLDDANAPFARRTTMKRLPPNSWQ